MKTIGVPLPAGAPGQLRLMETLGAVFGCRFEPCAFEGGKAVDAWFVSEPGKDESDRFAEADRPCFTIIREGQTNFCSDSSGVQFSNHLQVPHALRGREINSNESLITGILPAWLPASDVIGSKAGAPIWASRKHRGCDHHYVSFPIPELTEDEPLFTHFSAHKFLQLLPLLVFLRGLRDCDGWVPPPLSACFMFDDPNLHWPTYGYVNFEQILNHAQLHNHHVSFATIPLDAWFFHRRTALLFKHHSDRLSLLIHGNDHTRQELSQPRSLEESQRILQQAASRMTKFEKRSGVAVSKVMAAPHGACNANFLRAMARLGFEAASISRGSLLKYNPGADFVRTFGMRPVDHVHGLPVFPRFPICGSSLNDILVAALLDQPIILSGHHLDLSDGLEPLEKRAGLINSLGEVRWADLKQISRSRFACKTEGDALFIQMLSRRVEAEVGKGISKVRVALPQTGEPVPATFRWRSRNHSSGWKNHASGSFLAVSPGDRIEVAALCEDAPPEPAMRIEKRNLWPVIRRQFTEARDRLSPAFRRHSKTCK